MRLNNKVQITMCFLPQRAKSPQVSGFSLSADQPQQVPNT